MTKQACQAGGNSLEMHEEEKKKIKIKERPLYLNEYNLLSKPLFSCTGSPKGHYNVLQIFLRILGAKNLAVACFISLELGFEL